MKTLLKSLSILLFVGLVACESDKEQVADLVIRGGTIYTVNDAAPNAEAVAVMDNKIAFVGTAQEAEKWIGESTQVVELEGKVLTPGFIEGHGHFMGLGYNELNLDLLHTKSYDELLQKVEEAVDKAAPGEWIIGRGWHQSKWTPQPDTMVKGFPVHDRLSAVSPENPVFLSHASGHAALANKKAMEIAGVLPLSKESLDNMDVEGGEIIRDELGNPTGIFNETAQALFRKHIPETTEEKNNKAFDLAVQACYRNGITSFHDAGIGRETIDLYQKRRSANQLGVRIYAMLTGWDRELLEEWYDKGIMVDSSHWLTIRSIKLNCDGALGSRGAWLLEEYTDRPGHFGHETLPMEFVEKTAKKGLQHNFQVCAHAIGDRANREILDRYEIAFEAYPEKADDHRFRIEHAQHLHPEDIPRFADLGVIPAMQAIHMSSDRPWAIDRLGEKRIKEGAYVWQKLLESGIPIVNGTDVPVEPIDPIACFYASVSRKTLEGKPEGGYEPGQKMTREQALRSYTIDAAYGAFEEEIKGSVEVGKLADFTVFTQDIMEVDEDNILDTEIAMTFLNGKLVYNKE
ncbi:MAG: amidohydrolase [Fulvivirga sp.]|nr:amidohydrolase [Fulvivirga sp.]